MNNLNLNPALNINHESFHDYKKTKLVLYYNPLYCETLSSESLKVFIYVGKYGLNTAFIYKSKKSCSSFVFKDLKELENKIESIINPPKINNPYKVGDVFTQSFHYNCSRSYFYKVVAVTDKSLELVQIGGKYVEDRCGGVKTAPNPDMILRPEHTFKARLSRYNKECLTYKGGDYYYHHEGDSYHQNDD